MMNRRLRRNSRLLLLALIAMLAAGCLSGSTKNNPVVRNLTIDLIGEGNIDPAAGTHKISDGAVVNLKAHPAENWEFVKWMIGDDEDSDVEISVLMERDLTAIAKFKEIADDSPPIDETVSYTLTIIKNGEGTVTPDTGTHQFEAESIVELKAEPAENWEFEQWIINGNANLNHSVTLRLDQDFSATAIFKAIDDEPPAEEPVIYTLDLAIEGEGATSPAPGSHAYLEDTTIFLEAAPAQGWEFSKWQITDQSRTIELPHQSTFTQMNSDKAVTAIFKKIVAEPTTTLTITVIGEGTVTPGPGVHEIALGGHDVTADANDGWQLFGWIVEDSDGNKIREMLRNQSNWRYNDRTYRVYGQDNHLTVIFADELYDLNINAEYIIDTKPETTSFLPTARDAVGSRSYPENFEVQISTVTHRQGSTREYDEFRGWSMRSVTTGEYLNPHHYFLDYTDLETTVRIPNEDVIVTAEWIKWWRRVPHDFNYSQSGIKGEEVIHYFDLANLAPGVELDFLFSVQGTPVRFKIYYGTWDLVTAEVFGEPLFDTGWLSITPTRVSEALFPGVDHPHNHPKLEWNPHAAGTQATYPKLITKDQDRDYLIVVMENKVGTVQWNYGVRRNGW